MRALAKPWRENKLGHKAETFCFENFFLKKGFKSGSNLSNKDGLQIVEPTSRWRRPTPSFGRSPRRSSGKDFAEQPVEKAGRAAEHFSRVVEVSAAQPPELQREQEPPSSSELLSWEPQLLLSLSSYKRLATEVTFSTSCPVKTSKLVATNISRSR